ncbi:MAG: hypothetical protein ACLRSA_02030 [Streptococcus salivarius]
MFTAAYRGKQVKGNFAENGYYYDQHTGAKTDLGTNRYVQVNDDWYYIGSTEPFSKGNKLLMVLRVYFDTTTGKQAKEFSSTNTVMQKIKLWAKYC